MEKLHDRIPENVVRIEKPEAVFDVVYSKASPRSIAHRQKEDFEQMAHCDAIALEQPGLYSNIRVAEQIPGLLEQDPQYSELIQGAKETGKPFYLVDIQSNKTGQVVFLQKAFRGLEGVVGMMMLAKLVEKTPLLNKKMNRRDFLKFGANVVAGAYLASPLVGEFLNILRGNTTKEAGGTPTDISYFLNDLNEKIHPETEAVVQTFRNYLMAQKMHAIARTMESSQSKKPTLGLMIGARHTGMEDAMKLSDQERLEVLQTILSVAGLEEERRTLANIARFTYTGGKWNVDYIEDPELQNLQKN